MASVVALKLGLAGANGSVQTLDSCSGIYLRGSKSKTGRQQFLYSDDVILTSHPSLTIASNVQVLCAFDSSVRQETVRWHKLEVLASKPLPALSQLVRSMGFQYDFVPRSTSDTSGSVDVSSSSSASSDVIVTILKIASSSSGALPLKTHSIKSAEISQIIGSRLKIESCPFALVNPALFLGYTSHGSVSYVSRSKGEDDPVAVFTDLRFLDGMNGGMAYLDSSSTSKPSVAVDYSSSSTRQIVGLVVGKLCKKNGEGAMTVIAPWSVVSKIISQFCSINIAPSSPSYSLIPLLRPKVEANNSANQNLTPSAFYEFAANSIGDALCGTSHSSGVVAIVVNLIGGIRTWGSGVYIAKDLIVTNEHVVKGKAKSITAWFSKEHHVELTLLGSPIKGIDMSFLRISSPQPWLAQYSPVAISPLNVEPMEQVRSVGFGIFYPHMMGNTFSPLHSEGILSRVFYLPLTDSTKTPVPVMLVSSAGCWNGSSGGAVFSKKTDKLVGLMSSNGKEGQTGAVIPEMAFVIPAHLVELGRVLIDKQKQITATDRVRNLWQLRETHISVPKL